MSYSRWSNSPWYTFWHCDPSADGQPRFAAWLKRVDATPVLALHQVEEAMGTHDWGCLGHEITDVEREELEKLAGYWLADVRDRVVRDKEENEPAFAAMGRAWIAGKNGWRLAESGAAEETKA